MQDVFYFWPLITGQRPSDADAGGHGELAVRGGRGSTQTSLRGEAGGTQGADALVQVDLTECFVEGITEL